MTSKFFFNLFILLGMLFVGMVCYGIYFTLTHTPAPDYPSCQPTSGYCGPLQGVVTAYVMVAIGSIAFSLLSFAQSRLMLRKEVRSRIR